MTRFGGFFIGKKSTTSPRPCNSKAIPNYQKCSKASLQKINVNILTLIIDQSQ